jgi:hypothetical protein
VGVEDLDLLQRFGEASGILGCKKKLDQIGISAIEERDIKQNVQKAMCVYLRLKVGLGIWEEFG